MESSDFRTSFRLWLTSRRIHPSVRGRHNQLLTSKLHPLMKFMTRIESKSAALSRGRLFFQKRAFLFAGSLETLFQLWSKAEGVPPASRHSPSKSGRLIWSEMISLSRGIGKGPPVVAGCSVKSPSCGRSCNRLLAPKLHPLMKIKT
jgi:hypothetical protein